MVERNDSSSARVVRDDHAVGTVAHAIGRLVAAHDALDQELTPDEPAHAVKVIPRQRRRLRGFLHARDINAMVEGRLAHEIVRVVDMAVGAHARILAHRSHQRLVVTRPVVVDGEHDGAAAGALRPLLDRVTSQSSVG